MFDGEALGKQLVTIVRDYVSRANAGVGERVDKLERELQQRDARIAALEGRLNALERQANGLERQLADARNGGEGSA